MNTQGNNGYMLIFRGTEWYQGLSPEQMQQVADRWMAWFQGLKADGRVVAGNPLEREGRVVSGRNGGVVSDGPFVEAKETIGGYFLLQVASMDEAVAIAQQCPGLPYGIRVEVRPIAPECPVAAEARAGAQPAHKR
ncbi:MAG TPA: YciI family protein [Methylomirabilota bacterium]|nr:YciI family protein [Methylomirabilota bacterium]